MQSACISLGQQAFSLNAVFLRDDTLPINLLLNWRHTYRQYSKAIPEFISDLLTFLKL